ncbi:MAG: hypothetical protein ACRDL8_06115, partial [Solirubrobacteraceae bacterium]
ALDRARTDWAEAASLVGGALNALLNEDPDDDSLAEEVEAFSGFLTFADALDPLGPQDSDVFVTWTHWLFDRVPSATSQRLRVPDEWELRTRLAGEHWDRADSGAGDRTFSLRAAIAQLEAALPLTPGDDPGMLAAVLVPLTIAYFELLGGDETQYALVDRMVRHARRAWRALGTDEEPRPVIGMVLASGLHEQLIRPNAPHPTLETIDLIITVLREVVPHLAGDDATRLSMETLLSVYLVSRAQTTGSRHDLAEAQRIVPRLARELLSDQSQRRDDIISLAAAVTGLAHTGLLFEDIDIAIGVLREAAGLIADGERGAQVRAALGVTLVARSFDVGEADIREALAYLRAAHDMAPCGSPTRIWVALNLGSALLGEFFKTGDRQQLQAARFYLDTAEKAYRGELPQGGSERAVRSVDIPHLDALLAANRGGVALARALDGDAAAAGEAVGAFLEALDSLPAGHPHAVRVRGDLALARLLRASLRGSAERGNAEFRTAISELDAVTRMLPAGHVTLAAVRLRAGGAMAIGELQA